jgi:hypothetical protein
VSGTVLVMQVLLATADGLHTVDEDGDAKRLLPGAIGALAVAPDGAAWAVVDEHDVVRLDRADAEKIGHSGEQLTCIGATRDDVFVGTIGAHVLHLVDGTLARVESFEELDGRDGWTQPWGAPGDARSIATDGGALVLVNVHVGGILRSEDGGETWVQTIDPEVDVHQVALRPDDHLFAATGRSGLASSGDRGATWEYLTDGLHGPYARAVAPVDGGVVVSASSGPFSHDGALYRRPDGGGFERCDDGIPGTFDGNVDSHTVAAAGTTVVCAAPDGNAYVSADTGATWRVLAGGIGDATAVALR